MAVIKTPQTQPELVEFARETYRNLISKYENDGRQFIDIKEDTGVIYRCAGCVSLLLLINNFEIIDDENKGLQIVLAEFDEVMKHVTEKGYDASPIVAENATKKFFGPDASPRNHYTDTLSWVLSFSLQIRLASRRAKFKIDPEVLDRGAVAIKNVLELICDAACEIGGWNFSTGCTEPELYYSFAVSEALADFGDYALGETPEIFGEETEEAATDKELLAVLGGELIAKIDGKRKMTAKWLIDGFMPSLGTHKINPPNKPTQRHTSDHILLYYTYFVIDMLIICKADIFYENKDVNRFIEHGIYMSRIDYDKAAADTDWFTDPDSSTLALAWDNHPDAEALRRMKSETRLLGEPGLVPLSLRCNALYAYYIADGADRKMAALFDELIKNRHEETGLWDSLKYNLMITERAIEAIVDYQDYLVEFDKSVATIEPATTPESHIDSGFRALITECIEDYFSQNQSKAVTDLSLSSGNKSTEAVDELEVFRALTSAFATGEQLISGRESSDFPIDKKTFEKFCRDFNKFLVTSLCVEMKRVAKSKGDLGLIRENADKNWEALLHKLLSFLGSETSTSAGAMFEYLRTETVKNKLVSGGQ